jgi:hypothetical protein
LIQCDKNFNRIPPVYFQIRLEQWAATSNQCLFLERIFTTWRFCLSENEKKTKHFAIFRHSLGSSAFGKMLQATHDSRHLMLIDAAGDPRQWT